MIAETRVEQAQHPPGAKPGPHRPTRPSPQTERQPRPQHQGAPPAPHSTRPVDPCCSRPWPTTGCPRHRPPNSGVLALSVDVTRRADVQPTLVAELRNDRLRRHLPSSGETTRTSVEVKEWRPAARCCTTPWWVVRNGRPPTVVPNLPARRVPTRLGLGLMCHPLPCLRSQAAVGHRQNG